MSSFAAGCRPEAVADAMAGALAVVVPSRMEAFGHRRPRGVAQRCSADHDRPRRRSQLRARRRRRHPDRSRRHSRPSRPRFSESRATPHCERPCRMPRDPSPGFQLGRCGRRYEAALRRARGGGRFGVMTYRTLFGVACARVRRLGRRRAARDHVAVGRRRPDVLVGRTSELRRCHDVLAAAGLRRPPCPSGRRRMRDWPVSAASSSFCRRTSTARSGAAGSSATTPIPCPTRILSRSGVPSPAR